MVRLGAGNRSLSLTVSALLSLVPCPFSGRGSSRSIDSLSQWHPIRLTLRNSAHSHVAALLPHQLTRDFVPVHTAASYGTTVPFSSTTASLPMSSSPGYSHLTFSSLYLPPPLLTALTSLSYLHPSPIQLHSIPPALHGLDLICQAHSGTGKSLVFALLSLTHALRHPSPPRQGLSSLVLVPTRELGVQVEGVVRGLAEKVGGVRVESVMGGRGGVREDRERLEGCDVLIATVGRLKHLMEEGIVRAEALTLLTVDEADAFLSPTSSFSSDVASILAGLPSFPQRQTLLFSATWPSSVMERAKEVTTDAQLILLDSQKPHLSIQHFVFYIDAPTPPPPTAPSHSPHGTLSPLPSSLSLPPSLSSSSSSVDGLYDAKFSALLSLLSSFPFHQSLIFTRSPSHLSLLPHSLTVHGYPTLFLSASLDPSERTSTLSSFRSLHTRILVTSDVLSRGFDHPTINLVIHWDDPYNTEAFLHRGGRTGRWGRKGRTVWMVERGGEERVKRMERLAGLQLKSLEVRGGRVVVPGDDGGYGAEVKRERRRMRREAPHHKWALEKFDAARKGALEEMDDSDKAQETTPVADETSTEEEGQEGEGEDRDEVRDDGVGEVRMRDGWVVPPLVLPFSPFASVRVAGGSAPLFPLRSAFPLDVQQLSSQAMTTAAQFHRMHSATVGGVEEDVH